MRLIYTILLLYFLCPAVIKAEGKLKDIYRVAIEDIPDRIDPRRNRINTRHFINMHLYYPLFFLNDYNLLDSNFLDMGKTKASDLTFKNYILCLKEGKRFSDGTKITNIDFRDSARDAHRVIEGLKESKISLHEEMCIKVELKKEDHYYFDKLIDIRATILNSAKKKDKVPLGLGLFKMAFLSKEKIQLKRVQYKKNRLCL